MKTENAHIENIKTKFLAIESKEDLVLLLSEAKDILYNKKCTPFLLKSLSYHANPTLNKKRYRTFAIKKKSGGERVIHAPTKGLKSLLQALNFVLLCVYEPHKAATGFVKDKSIVDNARMHTQQNYVYNIDLKDFFHSFDRNRVKMGFMYEPLNLNGDREPLAFLLASLCTHPFEINGKVETVLPQGSPTSPTITNILCVRLDRRLNGLAKRFGARYSRYADDITFSSSHNIYKDEKFLNELKRIIEEDQKLEINPSKTRLQNTKYKQEVTGLIVNEKENVRRRYVKQIRMWLYYWEKYGYQKAEEIFKKDYFKDKGHIKKGEPNLENVLDGKLEYLKMVKGGEDETYLRLKGRFRELSDKLNPEKTKLARQIKKEEKKPFLSKENVKIPSDNLLDNIYPIKSNLDKVLEPNPKHVADFMTLFNQRDGLKYLTHDYDENSEFDIDKFLISANKVFEEKTEELNIPPSLWRIVKEFAFDSDQAAWTSISEDYKAQTSLKIGWATKELTDWSKKNHLHPIRNEEYRKIINSFKRITRIESSNLEKLIDASIESAFKKEMEYFEIEKIDLLKADFYSHIGFLKKAFETIFEEVKKHSNSTEKKKISIKYERSLSEDDYYLRKVLITHHNSYPTKELNLLLKEWREKGNMGNISKKLNGYCHWSVETMIEEKPTKVNILKDKNSPDYELLNQAINGFTHILTFYYK